MSAAGFAGAWKLSRSRSFEPVFLTGLQAGLLYHHPVC
jgi:hypothetical protein